MTSPNMLRPKGLWVQEHLLHDRGRVESKTSNSCDVILSDPLGLSCWKKLHLKTSPVWSIEIFLVRRIKIQFCQQQFFSLFPCKEWVQKKIIFVRSAKIVVCDEMGPITKKYARARYLVFLNLILKIKIMIWSFRISGLSRFWESPEKIWFRILIPVENLEPYSPNSLTNLMLSFSDLPRLGS